MDAATWLINNVIPVPIALIVIKYLKIYNLKVKSPHLSHIFRHKIAINWSFLKPKKIWNGINWSVDYNAIPVSMILILLAQNLQLEIKNTTTLGIVMQA